jgi:Sugar (and other) transporter
MIVEITPIALTNIKYNSYVIFAALNVCIAAIVYFTFPETKRLSIEELDSYFAAISRPTEGKKGKEGRADHIEDPAFK